MKKATHICKELGITNRQLAYWAMHDFVIPIELHPGIGSDRLFNQTEYSIAKHIVRLMSVGFTLQASAKYARSLVENKESFVDLGEKCLLMVELDL